MSSSSSCEDNNDNKPIKNIPAAYGPFPIISPIKDRIDFFYSQGQYKFFESCVAAHRSTVLRLNMIPGPFTSSSRVVALCDAVSFQTLFDPAKVEKKNSLTRNYFPSTAFTGGYRVCAYLNPDEEAHTKIKLLIFNAIASEPTTTSFTKLNEVAAFDFVCQTLVGLPKPDESVRSAALKFVFLQFHLIMTVSLPAVIEELFLHSFPFPTIIAKSAYKKLLDYFGTVGAWILDEAEKVGMSRNEAIHHVIFTWVVNAFLGIRTYLIRLFKWVVSAAGTDLHDKLAREVRSVVRSSNGEISWPDLNGWK